MRRRTSRIISTVLLSLIIALLTGSVVLAYLYRAPVAITENASSSYSMLPVLWTQKNTWLAANGFMSSTANDTRVQTLGGLDKPWMVADNKTLTAIPVPADSQTNLYFVTGESAASAMDIIVGYNGYITTLDDAALELGGNFTAEVEGYVDTAAGATKNILYKQDAFQAYVSGAGTITATVLSAPGANTYYNTGFDADVVGDDAIWLAQTFTTGAYGLRFNKVRVKMTQQNTAEAITASITTTDNVSKPTAVVLSTADGTEATGWVEIDLPDVTLAAATRYALVLNHTGDGWKWGTDSTAPSYAGGSWATSGDSGVTWTLDGTIDGEFELWFADKSVAGAVASGIHTLRVTASADTLRLYDGITELDTESLLGASVYDNANNYLWMQTNVMPYAEYLKITVGGTLIAYYQPITIINTTVLPDREGAAQNGAITWGSNPAGVGAVLGSMTSSSQPSVGGTESTDTSDILPPTGGTDWRPTAGVSAALLANPLRPVVVAISDNTTLSEYQVWVWFGIIAVIFVTALVGSRVKGHHLITGIAASAVIVLLVVWTVFPPLSLIVIVLAIWGGLISERSPSL